MRSARQLSRKNFSFCRRCDIKKKKGGERHGIAPRSRQHNGKTAAPYACSRGDSGSGRGVPAAQRREPLADLLDFVPRGSVRGQSLCHGGHEQPGGEPPSANPQGRRPDHQPPGRQGSLLSGAGCHQDPATPRRFGSPHGHPVPYGRIKKMLRKEHLFYVYDELQLFQYHNLLN